MKNPYDIYNDNRAYHGYEKCRKDIETLIEGIDRDRYNRGVIEWILKELTKTC